MSTCVLRYGKMESVKHCVSKLMVVGISENWAYNEHRNHLRPIFIATPVSVICLGVTWSTLATQFSSMAPVEVTGACAFKLMIVADSPRHFENGSPTMESPIRLDDN